MASILSRPQCDNRTCYVTAYVWYANSKHMDYKTIYRNGPGFNKPFIGIPIIKIIWSVTRQFYLYDGNSYYGKTAILSIQSSAVIMWSNIVTYYTNNYRNWGRILIRCWIHKRHPIPHPNGRDMGCLS